MAISVVLADDHPIVLDGLEQLFHLEPDFRVVARCHDGEEALAAVRRQRPDVLVLDVRMPRRDGLATLRALHDERSPTRVVLLAAEIEEEVLAAALALGVGGVVLKETAPHRLIEAVRAVHRGGRWLDGALPGRTPGRFLRRGSEAACGLTSRELEIVQLVGRGLRNLEIATELRISPGTVKTHLHNVFDKLKVRNRTELVLYAREHRLA